MATSTIAATPLVTVGVTRIIYTRISGVELIRLTFAR